MIGFAAMSDDEGREEQELDLSSSDVVSKYKSAAEIVNSEQFFVFCFVLICSCLNGCIFMLIFIMLFSWS